MRLEKRPLDFYGEVTDAQIEQLLVAETMPGESVAHGEQILAADTTLVKNRSFFAPACAFQLLMRI